MSVAIKPESTADQSSIREVRDDYVYIYSPDGDSAYRAADCMVLASVSKGRITERGAFEFGSCAENGNSPRSHQDS